jgi:hypothetical protein
MPKYESKAMNIIRSSNSEIEVSPYVLCISIFLCRCYWRQFENERVDQQLQTLFLLCV